MGQAQWDPVILGGGWRSWCCSLHMAATDLVPWMLWGYHRGRKQSTGSLKGIQAGLTGTAAPTVLTPWTSEARGTAARARVSFPRCLGLSDDRPVEGEKNSTWMRALESHIRSDLTLPSKL